MDDLLSEFLTETIESLSVLDVEMVKLERNADDKILGNIFRVFHTIKGTCGFLGLKRLETVAHAGENILGKFRDHILPVTPDAVSLILAAVDRIRGILSSLEETGREPEGDDTILIGELNRMADGQGGAVAEEDSDPVMDEGGFPVAAELLEEFAAMTGGAVPQAPATVQMSATPAPSQAAPAAAGTETRESAVAAASIRVNVEVLENLMTLVSELVLTRNQLLQMIRGRDDSEFSVPLQRLSHITSDLQEGVMKTRMQPIGNAWAKLPRLVRDLALETGKKIDLAMDGAETEIDRQVLELIKDPLTHMVRNSADHGLEPPEGRRAAGKGETGTITLRAWHEGGHIVLSIADDGRGLDIERIAAKALANGLVGETELEQMGEQQILQFIFKPGFSTAEKVTSVSGRGVGMDVVRNNIERIGGTIDLQSAMGKGTSVTIKIPLTLAIVSTLIVEAGAERFAIPQVNVLELVRVAPGSETRIDEIHNSPVLRLRDRLLPLIPLSDLLHLPGPATAPSREREAYVVVTQVGALEFGLIVDRVFDSEEISVKPVAPILRGIPYYSGNTILGDGSVIMILDPNGIASSSQIRRGLAAADKAPYLAGERSRDLFLVFRAAGLKAVPLALVARLEEVEASGIEIVHGRRVVQYRNHLMPVVPINQAQEWKTEGRQPVLVFAEGERFVGLAVEEILDIVDSDLDVELKAGDDGLIGGAVIAGKATDIVDPGYFLTRAFPDWFRAQPRPGKANGSDGGRGQLLLVDDSQFFCNILAPRLMAAGWRVTTVNGGEEALELCESGRAFAAIVSDIEMPGLDGFALARRLRSDERWRETPLIALSGNISEDGMEESRAAGFDDYVAKADWQTLIATVTRIIDDRHRASGGKRLSAGTIAAEAAE